MHSIALISQDDLEHPTLACALQGELFPLQESSWKRFVVDTLMLFKFGMWTKNLMTFRFISSWTAFC